jgi:hypothetical protein
MTLLERLKELAEDQGYTIHTTEPNLPFAFKNNRKLALLENKDGFHLRLYFTHDLGLNEEYTFGISEKTETYDLLRTINHEPFGFLTLDKSKELLDKLIHWRAYDANNDLIVTGEDLIKNIYEKERYPLASVSLGEGSLKYARGDFDGPSWGKNKGILAYEDAGTYIRFRLDEN